MTVAINYWAILGAVVASVVIGSVWYGPLFGKKWMALSGHEMGGDKSGVWKSYAIMIVASIINAYVLSHFLSYSSAFTGSTGASAGAMAGFWAWLGFIMPVSLSSVLWERKSWTLWFITSGGSLVTQIVMGIILALWK